MNSAAFTLSAFGDEIAADLDTQLALLQELRIRYLELRGMWGRNVLALDEDDLRTIQRRCAAAGVEVSCIGSPIGKSPLDDPVEREVANLETAFGIAERMGTRSVRVFSFYPAATSSNVHYDEHVEAASERLRRLADLARREGFLLLLENEKEIVGDTPRRCYRIVTAVNSPSLHFLWDPANFVEVGVEQPMTSGWPLLGPHVHYVHIKDAQRAGGIRAAGEGDGQLPELLAALRDSGYRGMLALEPHLSSASRVGGFSGPEGMVYAVQKLRQLMAEVGCVEVWEAG